MSLELLPYFEYTYLCSCPFWNSSGGPLWWMSLVGLLWLPQCPKLIHSVYFSWPFCCKEPHGARPWWIRWMRMRWNCLWAFLWDGSAAAASTGHTSERYERGLPELLWTWRVDGTVCLKWEAYFEGGFFRWGKNKTNKKPQTHSLYFSVALYRSAGVCSLLADVQDAALLMFLIV